MALGAIIQETDVAKSQLRRSHDPEQAVYVSVMPENRWSHTIDHAPILKPPNFGVKPMRPGFGPAAELPTSSPA
jgi:hypothetical protein